MRLKGLFLVIGWFSCLWAYAQRDIDGAAKWSDRIYIGGGGGFNAGTSSGNKYFSISLFPVVGYMVTSQFSAGTGISYQHTEFSDIGFKYKQYGLMPFVRYNFKELFLTAEYNYINLPLLKPTSNGYLEVGRAYRSRMLLGAGYTTAMGSRMRLNAMALYDVLYKPGNGFLSPWVFRVFFSF